MSAGTGFPEEEGFSQCRMWWNQFPHGKIEKISKTSDSILLKRTALYS
jgi:hypothetical protein